MAHDQPNPGDPKTPSKKDPPPREWDISDAANPFGDEPDGAEAPIADMQGELARLHAEVEDARQKYLRTLADFQNFQRRAYQNEQAARQGGIASVVERLVTVIDHFDMALAQDLSLASAQSVVDGVRAIRDEFLKTLQQSGVRLIAPAPGEEFTPGTHEAIMQMPAEGVEPGRVAKVFQAGYALGDRVIRAAKIAVAP